MRIEFLNDDDHNKLYLDEGSIAYETDFIINNKIVFIAWEYSEEWKMVHAADYMNEAEYEVSNKKLDIELTSDTEGELLILHPREYDALQNFLLTLNYQH